MTKLDNNIIKFINKHHVLTLATSIQNKPYCANCFYSYLESENMLVFTSDETTKHIKDALTNENIAGSIVLETRIIGKIQGIQFEGKLIKPDVDLLKKAHNNYLKRFPYAILMETTLWTIELTLVKMTNNNLGFGKKLIWKKN